MKEAYRQTQKDNFNFSQYSKNDQSKFNHSEAQSSYNDKESTEIESNVESTMVKSISILLNEIICENAQNTDNNSKYYFFTEVSKLKTGFTCKKPPSITIEAYLDRIIKYSKIEDSTLILALIYIDRICDQNNLQMTIYNIHRYLIFLI
jgi:hypothetical protein